MKLISFTKLNLKIIYAVSNKNVNFKYSNSPWKILGAFVIKIAPLSTNKCHCAFMTWRAMDLKQEAPPPSIGQI